MQPNQEINPLIIKGIYVALLSQTSTNAPQVTILQNTLGTIVWTRSAQGTYLGTLEDAFPANKTYIDYFGYPNNPGTIWLKIWDDSVAPGGQYTMYRNSTDEIAISSRNADGTNADLSAFLGSKLPITIKTYY